MTLDYYNTRAEEFRQRTKDLDLSREYDAFLAHVPPGGHILDGGCGPGRDSLAFLRRGYRVTAFDASSAMVAMATETTRLPVRRMTFQEVECVDEFDGIWTMASLLHVPPDQIDGVVRRLTRALKLRGVWYMSFKVGDAAERLHPDGRWFYDHNEPSLRALVDRHRSLELLDVHESRGITPPNWLHALVRRTS